MKIYWTIWAVILIILELPLIARFIRYNKEYELSRQIAVTILMFVTALIVLGLSNFILTLLNLW